MNYEVSWTHSAPQWGAEAQAGRLALIPPALLSVGSTHCCLQVGPCNPAHGSVRGGRPQGGRRLRGSLQKTPGWGCLLQTHHLICFSKRTKKRRERECQGWDHRRSRKEVALPARLLKGNHTRRRKPASLRITARDDKKPWAPCLRGSRGWDRVEGKPTCSLRPTQRGFLRNGLGSQTKSPGRALRAGSLASRCYSARDERSASGSPEQSWGVSRHNQSLEYAPPPALLHRTPEPWEGH